MSKPHPTLLPHCSRRQAPHGYKWITYHNRCLLVKRNARLPNNKLGMIPIECEWGGTSCWGETQPFGGYHGDVNTEWQGYQGVNNNGGSNSGNGNGTVVVNTQQVNSLLNSNSIKSIPSNNVAAVLPNALSAFIQDNKTILLTGAVGLAVALIANKAK